VARSNQYCSTCTGYNSIVVKAVKKVVVDNQYHFYKVKDKHFSGSDLKIPVKDFTDLTLYTPVFQQISFASQQRATANKSHAPPLHTSVPIYISTCVFRI